MKAISTFYKGIRLIKRKIYRIVFHLITSIKLKGNNVQYSNFKTNGIPYISVARGGSMIIGTGFSMNNYMYGNPIGCNQPCTFFVNTNCKILIGDNVGISQASLLSYDVIEIGNNVKIGGGVHIYTTDFHSLNPVHRLMTIEDFKHRKSSPVIIKNNVFIGARSTILKGVIIGENSIVGAGSIVTKSIPANQIWAGNPAKFIKNVQLGTTFGSES